MHKIFFAGISGSGKSKCIELLISRINSKNSNLEPNYSGAIERINVGRSSFIFAACSNFLKRRKSLAIKCHFFGIYQIIKFVTKYLEIKYLELLKKGDFIIYETDFILHPSAYITYTFPLSKKISSSLRFRIFSMFFRTEKKYMIFYLDTDPKVAMERIRKRETEPQAHENIKDLKELKHELDNLLEIGTKNGLRIYKIKTDEKNEEEVADEVQKVLEKTLPVLKL